ncbi:MAG: hypothetical protein AAFO98_08800 [Pseudomonadota bacterium]
MRKPANPGYHSLGALSRAIQREIKLSFPVPLRLAGDLPDEWPDSGTPDGERLIRQVKSGLAFYCMEYFLWPNGRHECPIDIWVGHTLRKSARCRRDTNAHLFQLGQNKLPGLADVLWTPRTPNVQPVALRTYADAMIYRRAGALIERRFLPLITATWRVREHLLEQAKVPSEFHHRFRFKELYYFGDYPSRIVENMVADIHHVLRANKVELHLPPSAAVRKAFQRQVTLLREAWDEVRDERDRPGVEWVRQRLLRPEYDGQIIENGYAERYRRALVASLQQAEVKTQ